jgi:hypothetical protein
MVEKSGVEQFMVEKSKLGVEKSRVEMSFNCSNHLLHL